jgi:hypothetical protein
LIRLTDHAKGQMRLRSLAVGDIEAVVSHPTETVST